MSHLANIVSRSQRLLSEVLQPGDLAVDLTAGNGSDTLFLAQTVGPTGTVLAFDIQVQALASEVVIPRERLSDSAKPALLDLTIPGLTTPNLAYACYSMPVQSTPFLTLPRGA